jgi:periplasmic protein TonB
MTSGSSFELRNRTTSARVCTCGFGAVRLWQNDKGDHIMFQQLIASSPSKAHREPLTLILSVILHGFFILLLIAVPLVHPETLANLQMLMAPPPTLSAPQRALVRLISSAGKPRPTAARPNSLFTPDFIPAQIDLTSLEAPEAGEDSQANQVGLPIGNARGSNIFLDGFSHEAPRAVLPPEPPVSTARAEAHVTRIRQGGELQHANLLRQVKPSYPQLAKAAQVQGTVVLEAIIDREGRVEGLKVLSGHPLLIPAAFEAVQQWRYRPTLLNGQPVEVLTQVTVNFSLGAP